MPVHNLINHHIGTHTSRLYWLSTSTDHWLEEGRTWTRSTNVPANCGKVRDLVWRRLTTHTRSTMTLWQLSTILKWHISVVYTVIYFVTIKVLHVCNYAFGVCVVYSSILTQHQRRPDHDDQRSQVIAVRIFSN